MIKYQDKHGEGLPVEHVLVACFGNNESAIAAVHWATLSRDQVGGYWLTLSSGRRFLHADDAIKAGDQNLLRTSQPLHPQAAVEWLERELCYAVARGDSPYCKHLLIIDRAEVGRLIGDLKIEDFAYLFISRLLMMRPNRTAERTIRPDKIPHAKICFTEGERDRVWREEDLLNIKSFFDEQQLDQM